MNPSADELGTLSVAPEFDLNPRDIPRRIQITDNTLSLAARGFGHLENTQLPAGVYRVLVESSVKPFEKMVFLPPGKSVSVQYPTNLEERLPSGAPVPGAQAMHEYMRLPLEEAVMQPHKPEAPSRFILMATKPALMGVPIQLQGFRLLDAKGKKIASFADNEPGSKATPEWFISALDLEENGYLLESPHSSLGPNTSLRLPLWLSRSWCTIVFLDVDPESGLPNLAKASIYLWRIGTSFAPELVGEPQNAEGFAGLTMKSQRYTELALHSLVGGRDLLSIEEVDTNLLAEKFSNPMLGILGFLLLARRVSKDQSLMCTVLANLDNLIPCHPDVRALKVIASQLGVKPLMEGLTGTTWPPMLRQGFLSLRDEDWQTPETIMPGSLFDNIRTCVLSGSAWTLWAQNTGSAPFSATSKTFRSPLVQRLAQEINLSPQVAESIISYTSRFPSGRRGNLTVEDLRWTGLSRQRAARTLEVLRDTPDSSTSS